VSRSHLATVLAGIGAARRVVIIGGPRTGKSTLAKELAERLGVPVRPTDDLREKDWSAQSDGVLEWLREPGPAVIEGTAAVRGLRKLLKEQPGHPGVVVVHLRRPMAERSPGQVNMATGLETIWKEVAPELRKRGVAVLTIL
jgi:broad-specificity NMP kinase